MDDEEYDDRPRFIYVLHEPWGNDPRYVGKTLNPDTVIDRHFSQPNLGTPRCKWIAELAELGQRPVLEVVERFYGPYDIIERVWIAAYARVLGTRLLNLQYTTTRFDADRRRRKGEGWRKCPDVAQRLYQRYMRISHPKRKVAES